MPELRRRAGLAAAIITLTAAFALSLVGIADTQGTLRSDGEAAAVAAQQRADERVAERDCQRDQRDQRAAPSDAPV